MYSTNISHDTISKITDRVLGELAEWLNRPLDRVYPVIFIDAIVVKIRDSQVANRPVYTAIAVTVDGNARSSVSGSVRRRGRQVLVAGPH